MSRTRADLGFGDQLDGFNPDEWKPQKKTSSPETSQKTRQAAAIAGFKSREASQAVEPVQVARRAQRRRRTGRNAQLNIKLKPETIEAFYRVADARGWGLGETLEHAVELLQREVDDEVSTE